MSITRTLGSVTLGALAALAPVLVADAHAQPTVRLAGRAVLPVETYAPGPPSGNAFAGQVINGISFPLASQPVEGFSAIVAERPGEYLAMPDNGFGNKANSADFLIRAYRLAPDFRTPQGGTGTVGVGTFIQFADPDAVIGFPIVNEGSAERWLTGADIDPESLQRDNRGDLWVGDEFGPWILHFDGSGRLLEPPISLPDGLVSPSHPTSGGAPTVANSRGIEAMAMSPNGQQLTVVLEGAVPVDDPATRRIYRYDTRAATWSRLPDYRVDAAGNFVSDAQQVDGHRLLLIERDGGSGLAAMFRRIYAVDLNVTGPDGAVQKSMVVDLTAIPDPDGLSLPPLHDGDVGLGDPFRVTCESVEALHVRSHAELLVGCDNNFPNTGRNPARADDSEFIVIRVPGL